MNYADVEDATLSHRADQLPRFEATIIINLSGTSDTNDSEKLSRTMRKLNSKLKTVSITMKHN